MERESFNSQSDNHSLEWQVKGNHPNRELTELKAALGDRDQEIRSLKIQVQERQDYIDEITQSKAWVLVQWLWGLHRTLFPDGSLRKGALGAIASPFLAIMRLGVLGVITALLNRISQVRLVRRVSRALARLLPRPVRDFLLALKQELPLVDRSTVILFADEDILPAYIPRHPLQPVPGEIPTQVKVSLIATVYNEAQNIREWLHSIFEGYRLPDEIVIVDAGSRDSTVDIIRELALTSPVDIKVIEEVGANIARGRNIAIKHTSFPIIACSDLGCVLDKNWLKYLIFPFEVDQSIEFCTGYYQALATDEFTRLASPHFIADLNKLNPQKFLPSSRSIAMSRSLWERAGGYPQWLTDAAEDTLFDYQVKLQPVKWAFVPQAVACWQPPQNLRQLFKTFFRYAKGDGEAGMFASLYREKITVLLWRSFLLAALLVLLVLAGIWAWNSFDRGMLAVLLGAAAFLAVAFLLIDLLRTSARLQITPRIALSSKLMPKAISLARPLGYLAGIRSRSRVEHRKIAFYRHQLEEILEKHPIREGVILYPPTHDWGYMFQLPHQMARGFARKGYLYFYCTTNEITDAVVGFQEVEPLLCLTHVPLEVFRIVQDLTVYVGSPWHRHVPELFENPRIIYDHYDDLQVSSGRLEDHRALLQAADVVLVTAKRLLDDINPFRPDALFLPNGVDYEYLRSMKPGNQIDPPLDWRPIANAGKPVIGYSGSLAERFDYDLFRHLVTARPDLEFVLIGVSYDGSLERSGILDAGFQNLHWLGMKPYDQLFRYVWRFDAGIIPFKINRITQATTSIKLFEYMACHVPVLSTAMPESRRYPGVFIAEDADDLIDQIDQALAAGQDPAYLDLIDKVAREHSWEQRVEAVIKNLERA